MDQKIRIYTTTYTNGYPTDVITSYWKKWTKIYFDFPVNSFCIKFIPNGLIGSKLAQIYVINNPNLSQSIKYLTKGGCSEIYTALWIDGYYEEWDSKEKQLKRNGLIKIVLKTLENVVSANKSWFDEGISHLQISSQSPLVVRCFGLTQNPFNGKYMIVMNYMNINLREYLQQNHNKLTWKEGIQIIYNVINAVCFFHKENVIHRDLHSGNVLFSQINQRFYVSDLGFCGPANIPLDSIYGNLSYIAPEVIVNKKYSFASDIYSIGMLMWEISSGQPPFIKKHDYDLAIKIINGMRPKIIPGTPLKYKELMEQCWDANPMKRPDIYTLLLILQDLLRLYTLNENEQRIISKIMNINNFQLNKRFNINSSSTNNSFFGSFSVSSSINWNISSRVYNFENLPEPRNATKAYHSIQFDFDLQDGMIIDDERDLAFNSNKKKYNIMKLDTNICKEIMLRDYLNTKTRVAIFAKFS
ncbi:kinase-like domain-containing protein [Rhizophagus diaphanus]|nr:kinase-like domain-containing protein [Rhizophagus diaphanus] [Rhizophagus sp. MUCL 43196]